MWKQDPSLRSRLSLAFAILSCQILGFSPSPALARVDDDIAVTSETSRLKIPQGVRDRTVNFMWREDYSGITYYRDKDGITSISTDPFVPGMGWGYLQFYLDQPVYPWDGVTPKPKTNRMFDAWMNGLREQYQAVGAPATVIAMSAEAIKDVAGAIVMPSGGVSLYPITNSTTVAQFGRDLSMAYASTWGQCVAVADVNPTLRTFAQSAKADLMANFPAAFGAGGYFSDDGTRMCEAMAHLANLFDMMIIDQAESGTLSGYSGDYSAWMSELASYFDRFAAGIS